MATERSGVRGAASIFTVNLRRALGLLALTISAAATRLSGQEVQFQPQAGLSLPTRVSLKDGSIHILQKIGYKFGARLNLIFNDRFDVTTGVSYVPGYATLQGGGKRVSVGTSSQVLSAATGARYWIRPEYKLLSWEIHTGMGVVFGGTPPYEELFESSTVTGVLGTTLRYQWGGIASFTMRLQQRLYRLGFGKMSSGTSSNPFQVTFAVGLPWLGRLRPSTSY
jgi:hypothetical protein